MSRTTRKTLTIAGVVVAVLGLAACGRSTATPTAATPTAATALAAPSAEAVADEVPELPDDDLEAKVAKIRKDRKKAAAAQARAAAQQVGVGTSVQAVTVAVPTPTTKAKAKKKKKVSSLSAADRAYLHDVSGSGLRDEYTDASLINFGEGVCRGFEDGGSTEAIYVALQVVGFSQSDAVLVMAAGLNEYCPQYWDEATAGTSTTTTVVDGRTSYQDPQFNIGDITVPAPYEVRQ